MSDRDIVTIDQQQKLINKTEEKYKNTKKVFFSLSLSLFKKKHSSSKKAEKFLIPHYDLKWVTHKLVCTSMSYSRGKEREAETEKWEREYRKLRIVFFGCLCKILSLTKNFLCEKRVSTVNERIYCTWRPISMLSPLINQVPRIIESEHYKWHWMLISWDLKRRFQYFYTSEFYTRLRKPLISCVLFFLNVSSFVNSTHKVNRNKSIKEKSLRWLVTIVKHRVMIKIVIAYIV